MRLPRLRAEQVETAVAGYFATLRLGTSFIAATRSAIEAGMKDAAKLDQQMRRKLRQERTRIAEQRSQLVDLVGNWPQDLLDAKMRDLSDQRTRIDGELENTDSTPMIEAGKAVNTLLELLDTREGSIGTSPTRASATWSRSASRSCTSTPTSTPTPVH